MYLIHWPGNDKYMTAWRALEDLYLDGKIKAIGVSNFQISHLETLLAEARVVPAINQVELHPRLSQIQIREFGKKTWYSY